MTVVVLAMLAILVAAAALGLLFHSARECWDEMRAGLITGELAPGDAYAALFWLSFLSAVIAVAGGYLVEVWR